MQVLEYGQGLGSFQLIERGREDCVAACAARDSRQQRALRLARDVMERCERPGREQCVARAPQHPPVAHLPSEFLQQGRLAYSGLTTHQHDASTEFLCRVEPGSEIGE